MASLAARLGEKRKAINHGVMEWGVRANAGQHESRVEADARVPVNTPQVQVMMTANIDSEECVKRQRLARHVDEVLAPASLDDKDHQMRQGFVVMHVDDGRNGLGRTHLQSDTSLFATCTPAGLPVDAKLFLPALAAGDPHDGNQQVTVKVHGVDMATNFDSDTIHCGDMLVVDPVPNMVPCGPNKQLKPGVYGPKGVSENLLHWRVRGVNPQRQQSWEQQILDESRVRMGLDDHNDPQNFKARIHAAKTYPDIVVALTDHCNRIFDEMYKCSDIDPTRGFLLLHSAKFLLNMVLMGNVEVAVAAFETKCRQALLQILRDVQEYYLTRANEFMGCLPANFTREKDYMEVAARKLGLDSDLNNAFLKDGITTVGDMRKVCAVIDHQFDYYVRLQSHRIADFRQRYTLGMALSAAAPGKNFDLFVGKK